MKKLVLATALIIGVRCAPEAKAITINASELSENPAIGRMYKTYPDYVKTNTQGQSGPFGQSAKAEFINLDRNTFQRGMIYSDPTNLIRNRSRMSNFVLARNEGNIKHLVKQPQAEII